MKSLMEEILEIEGRAKQLRLPMAFVLWWAGVPKATWSRWKASQDGKAGPTKKNWDKVTDAVADLEKRLKR